MRYPGCEYAIKFRKISEHQLSLNHPGFGEGTDSWGNGAMSKSPKPSPKARERAPF